MKRKIYNICNLLLMCMFFMFTACTDVIVTDPNPIAGDGSKEIPITLNFKDHLKSNRSTYGVVYPDTPDPGFQAERDIDNIIVYIFDYMFICEKILYYSSSIPDPIGPIMVKSGMKHFVVVANGDGKFIAPDSLVKYTPSLVVYSDLMNKITTASASLPATPQFLLMTGIENNVPVPNDAPIGTPHPVSIEITRACAKIKMQITKSLKAASHELTIKSITMYRGADRVALFKGSFNPAWNILSVSDNSFTSIDTVRTYPNYYTWKDSLYTYENLCGRDSLQAVRFEILVAVNSPSNERTAKFYLATDDRNPTDSIFNVYRNFWYDIKVNFVDPGMDSVYIDIKACPWNVADPYEVYQGHGAEISPATPLKLVKNYTASDWGSAPFPYAAIQSHSKGASWIDMKVTDGTPWKIDVKDISAPRNQGVYYSLDSATWLPLPTTGLVGDNDTHRIYIYRWYRENEEPSLLGPSLYVGLSDDNGMTYKHYRDIIIEPRDLTPFPTNCYVMRPQLAGSWPINETRAYIPLAGVYSVWEDYLYENGNRIPDGEISAVLLWDDQGGGVVKNIKVINPFERDSAYLYAEAEGTGNAFVGIKVGTSPNDTIYWSFHLWVTEYNPYEAAGQKLYSSSTQTNVFMDRNLGAFDNMYLTTGKSRGLFYQFGRKDPFPGGVDWSNTTFPTYPTPQPAPASTGFVRPLRAIQASIANPGIFYTKSTSVHWSLSLDDPDLWITAGGNKTAYDPCPEGWRVPMAVSPSSDPWIGEISTTTLGYGDNGFYHPKVGYYPFSGYVNYSTSTGLMDATVRTYLWTSYSSPSVINSWGLEMQNTSTMGMLLLEKSYGASVRCVVDKNYIRKKGRLGLFGAGTDNLLLELGP